VRQKIPLPMWSFDAGALQRARERRGLSRSALGRRMQPIMAASQIADIEERRQGITVTTLLRL